MAARKPSSDPNKAVSQKTTNSGCGGCGIMFFFAIFLLVGIAAFVAMFIIPMMNIFDARDWPSVPCLILSSEIESHSDGDGVTYSVEINYQYEIDGQTYQSDRYRFLEGSSSGRRGKQKVVDRYPPKSKNACYVDPDDPTSAVIDRDFSIANLLGLLPLLFVAVGGGGLLFCSGLLGKGKRLQETVSATTDMSSAVREDLQQADWLDSSQQQAEGGPARLKANVSPMGAFLGLTFATVFWNGLVSVFLFAAIDEFFNGEPQVCMSVFLIPFVLVGLVLIFVTFQAFLKLFNPRPTLAISDTRVPLGGELELAWSFKGSTRSIRRLKIELVGKETARYRRGTSTYTDEEQFATIEILDASNMYKIASGETSFTVPHDTMHTFGSSNNKIIWSLVLSGEIAWWPDIDESYPITVLPPTFVKN